MNIIDRHTFEADGTNAYGSTCGTVVVDTGRGKERTRAVKYTTTLGGETINAAGFVGRYRTVNTPWPASLTSDEKREIARFGRDDRSGRFNKMRAISWEPETFAKLTNAAYWQPQ